MVGFQEEEVLVIYKMLAAILHLGDIEFGETAGEDNTDNKATIIDTAPLHRGKLMTRLRLYNEDRLADARTDKEFCLNAYFIVCLDAIKVIEYFK